MELGTIHERRGMYIDKALSNLLSTCSSIQREFWKSESSPWEKDNPDYDKFEPICVIFGLLIAICKPIIFTNRATLSFSPGTTLAFPELALDRRTSEKHFIKEIRQCFVDVHTPTLMTCPKFHNQCNNNTMIYFDNSARELGRRVDNTREEQRRELVQKLKEFSGAVKDRENNTLHRLEFEEESGKS
ncbi:hypothetical protein CASFOL_003937 [Castilleja foliolosa]|uniref:Uncharacterized protein n=1 Tax=Castilleja foliolosa TaxID=1961234 RepID=A0ABD3EJ76_9LAMI